LNDSFKTYYIILLSDYAAFHGILRNSFGRMKESDSACSDPDFSTGFRSEISKMSWIQGARRTDDAGILINMLKRLFKCNAVDMSICEVAAESL